MVKVIGEEYHNQFNERFQSMNADGLRGSKRVAAVAAKEALEELHQCGQKARLTENKKTGVRSAVAALVLQERINGKTGSKSAEKYPSKPKEYAKTIKLLADSTPFKKQFPDSKLTPSYCRDLAADPNLAAKEMKRFYKDLSKLPANLKPAVGKEMVKGKGKQLQLKDEKKEYLVKEQDKELKKDKEKEKEKEKELNKNKNKEKEKEMKRGGGLSL